GRVCSLTGLKDLAGPMLRTLPMPLPPPPGRPPSESPAMLPRNPTGHPPLHAHAADNVFDSWHGCRARVSGSERSVSPLAMAGPAAIAAGNDPEGGSNRQAGPDDFDD